MKQIGSVFTEFSVMPILSIQNLSKYFSLYNNKNNVQILTDFKIFE